MFIKNINLFNFRNYENEKFIFNDHINIIYGKNAQGKTNLLESIYFLILAKSHRSINDKDLIKYGCDSLKVSAEATINNIPKRISIEVNQKNKKFFVDGNNIKKVSDYISNLKVIVFFPEDLELIKLSPDVRRKYLNIQISQLNKNYFKILNDYNKLLKIRNDILKEYLKSGKIDNNYFDIITNYLIDKASYIYCIRNKYIEKINEIIDNYYEKISTFKKLKINYINNLNTNIYEFELNKEILKSRFDELKEIELKTGNTLIGPHKDDMEFLLDGKDLKKYGSQGQQRMAVLALKLSEIELFRKECGENPILLLDDVFSELDDYKKNNLLDNIDSNIQTIITTTDLNNINKKILGECNLIKIENGRLRKGD